MPVAEKRGFGHFVIDTSASPSDTDRAADALARRAASLRRERPAAAASRSSASPGRVSPTGRVTARAASSPERTCAAAGRARDRAAGARGAAFEPPATGPWYGRRGGEPALPGERALVGGRRLGALPPAGGRGAGGRGGRIDRAARPRRDGASRGPTPASRRSSLSVWPQGATRCVLASSPPSARRSRLVSAVAGQADASPQSGRRSSAIPRHPRRRALSPRRSRATPGRPRRSQGSSRRLPRRIESLPS